MPPSSTMTEPAVAVPESVRVPAETDAVVTVIAAFATPLRNIPADKAVVVTTNDLTADFPKRFTATAPEIVNFVIIKMVLANYWGVASWSTESIPHPPG